MKLKLLLLALMLTPSALALGGDINDDGYVNVQDLLSVAQHVGRGKAYDAASDINSDGLVNIFDLTRVSRDWGVDYWVSAPSRTNLRPSGQLATGIGSATLQVTTNISANCSYSATPGTAYAYMAQFNNTGGTNHSSSLAVQDGRNYNYYVKCRDVEGRTNRNDAVLFFSVASPAGGVQPFFQDTFDAYGPGTALVGRGTNSFLWGASTYTRVSSDIAYSGGESLEFAFGPIEPNGDTHMWSEQPFQLGRTVQELWMEFYIYFPEGSEGFSGRYEQRYPQPAGSNNKFVAVWGNDYDRSARVTFQSWVNGTGPDNIVNVYIGPPDSYPGPNVPFVSDERRGRWVQWRQYIRSSSTLGTNDGAVQAWMDGALILDLQDLNIDGDNASYSTDFRQGYLMGYDNAWAYALGNISVFIDDVKFYDQDPGWSEAQTQDITPPTASITAPSADQVFAAGTLQTTLNVTTNESALCRWSATDQAYDSMANTFTITGGTNHSTTLTGLQDGQSYTHYVRCTDAVGNAMTASQSRSFSVANPSAGGGLLFASDWSTATGAGAAALQDAGKSKPWLGTPDNSSVVPATGLGFPTGMTNVLAVGASSGSQTLSFSPAQNYFPVPAVGESLYYRLYQRVEVPDSYSGGGDLEWHPWQDSYGPGNWVGNVITFQNGSWSWRLQTNNNLNPNPTWPYYHWGRNIHLDIGEVYRLEWQIHRTGANTFQIHPRVYDAAGTLLYTDNNIRSVAPNNPTTLQQYQDAGNHFSFGDLSALPGLTVGVNGFSDGGGDFVFSYTGGVCIRGDDWCGPYQPGEASGNQ